MAQPGVSIAFDNNGLSSLKYNGTEFIVYGDLRLDQVTFSGSGGSTFSGSTTSTVVVDPVRQTQTRTYSWGTIVAAYAVTASNRLNLTVTVNNASSSPISEIWYETFGLQFPSTVQNYNGVIPIINDTIGQPAVVNMNYAGGVLVVADDNVSLPLQLGFPWAFNPPTNSIFPLSVNTGTVSSYPNQYPMIARPIAAGGSDQYQYSLRFGPTGSTVTSLAPDVYQNFAAAFPPTLQWKDRRPIGQLILATAAAGYPTNPRGWFLDPTVNVSTPAGIAAFQQELLNFANNSISILKSMNAQGMITWDIEGQQFPDPVTYVCDPTQFAATAPEMAGIADQYFQLFINAGLRVGVCIRPQQFTLAPGGGSATQTSLADPTQILIAKASYAHSRWGATLFYIDSNVNVTDPNPIDPNIIKTLSTMFPDSLFIPEHSNTQYYAYSAPYLELRQGYTSTAPDVRFTYPQAFTNIYTPDGPLSQDFNQLVTAVQQGDSLMFRGWFADPQNQQVLSIYQAAVPTTLVSINPTSGSLSAGQTQPFTASVTGSANQQVTWSLSPQGLGSVSSSGLYTAPSSIAAQQTVAVIATSVADTTKSATALVTLNPAVAISINPAASSLSASQTQQFTASVTGSTNQQVTWSLSPQGIGNVSSTGLYTAPSSISTRQTVTVVATSTADATKSASALVTLNPAAVAISINPTVASLAANQTQQFTASVTGSANQQVTWSLSPQGLGNVSSSGLYTAPSPISSQQTVTVIATSAADATKSASATVALTAPVALSCGSPSVNAFTGCYYQDRSFAVLAFTRVDPQIAFNWGGNGPGSGVGPNNFSVRWQGNFTFSAANYTFTLATDDGSRLYIDGQLTVDNWSEQPAIPNSKTVPVAAGVHLIEVDYFQLDGGASANVTWTISGAVGITLSPASSTLAASQSQQFTASVTGAANQQVTWSLSPQAVGSISNSGLYTAPATIASQQTVTVTATSAADPTKSASSVVTLTPAVAISVNPPSASLGANQTQQFTASVTGAANQQVTWSLSPQGVGSISSNGLYTAPSAISFPQTLTVTATSVADTSKSASSALSLTAAVALSCGPPSVNAFTGCYYQDRSFGVLNFSRVDPQIAFNWGGNGAAPGVGPNNFTVRWQGLFSFAAGSYTFTLATDDGSRLYMDGQLIVDYWSEHAAIPYSQTVTVTPGQHLIQVDYFQLDGAASANVTWSQN